jgi:hypothetical protein
LDRIAFAMSKPDRAAPGYAASLASSRRWDGARDEPYLQLPSFPDLRLVPYRPGIADDLVSLGIAHARCRGRNAPDRRSLLEDSQGGTPGTAASHSASVGHTLWDVSVPFMAGIVPLSPYLQPQVVIRGLECIAYLWLLPASY